MQNVPKDSKETVETKRMRSLVNNLIQSNLTGSNNFGSKENYSRYG